MNLLKANSYKLQAQKGFTLLELLVVIAIIAILIALGTISYSTAQKKSRDAKRHSDIKEIQNALEAYHATDGDGSYPADASSLDDPKYFPAGARPTDPKSGDDYVYSVSAANDAYCVCTDTLETTSPSNPAGNADTQGTNGTCSYTAGDFFCVSSLQ